jgi:hypothetical protein
MALDGSSFLRSLRRFHAWVGLSGAAFGLLFGLTGLLQNHRSVMKVDLGNVEERKVQVELAAPAESPEALAQALQTQLGWKPERMKTRVQKPRGAKFQGADVKAAETWMVLYSGHMHSARAAYAPGNKTVELEQQDANLIETLSRLHRADGGQAAWILLTDAVAMGLIFMSLSGTLLWTKLSGPRLLAVGLSLTGMVAALIIASRAW